MKWHVAIFASLFAAHGAQAATITFDLPGDATAPQTVNYDCGGQKISATYINAGDNALAILNVGDRVVAMANVIAASGGRYAGQDIIWWTKGEEATLYDLHKGDDDPGLECKAAK